MGNRFDKPPVVEAFDYKSDLEKHFERKDFFNEDFSKENLHKLFELLIDYDNDLEKVFASKKEFDLLEEFNSKTRKIVYLLRDYIKDNHYHSHKSPSGRTYGDYKMIGENDFNIEKSLSLVKNYQTAVLQDEFSDFMYKEHRKNDDIDFRGSAKMGAYYQLEDLELANQMQKVKDNKDPFFKEKLKLFTKWEKIKSKRDTIKNAEGSLKKIDKVEFLLKEKKERELERKRKSDRFQENKSNFDNKDNSKLKESLYFKELQDYWLDGEESKEKKSKRNTLKYKNKKQDRFNDVDKNSFIRSLDSQHPAKVLAFTVNYEKVHISKIKEQLFSSDKFLNQKENADKKLKLEKLIGKIKDNFSGEWELLQKEIRESERTGDYQLENVDVAAFLAKWFNNKKPYGKLLDLSHVLRNENKWAKQENKRIKNAENFNNLYERIEQIIKEDPLEESLSELKTPEKLVDEMKEQVPYIEEKIKKDGEGDNHIEVPVEDVEKTVDWYKENIKLTGPIQAYLTARAKMLGDERPLKAQMNNIDDFDLLEELYNVSQGK